MSKVLTEETSHSDLLVSLWVMTQPSEIFFPMLSDTALKKKKQNILTGPLPGKKSFAILCPLRES